MQNLNCDIFKGCIYSIATDSIKSLYGIVTMINSCNCIYRSNNLVGTYNFNTLTLSVENCIGCSQNNIVYKNFHCDLAFS